jgi:hypothetical protein
MLSTDMIAATTAANFLNISHPSSLTDRQFPVWYACRKSRQTSVIH